MLDAEKTKEDFFHPALYDAYKEMEERINSTTTTLAELGVWSSYVQYYPKGGLDEDWGSGKCHYELLIADGKANLIQVCFHCEHEYAYQKSLANYVKQEPAEEWPQKRVQKKKSWILYKEISLDEPDAGKKAAIAMIDFYNNYGQKINTLIKKSKASVKPSEESTMAIEKIKETLRFLEANHNIILHGAPGTGKTYLAKQVAKEMIFNEEERALLAKEESSLSDDDKKKIEELNKQFKEQCGFVQFHQSYDYTDFVEGLRPDNPDKNQDKNGNIGFVRKDGVFKAFCGKALKKDPSKKSFDEAWDLLIQKVVEGEKNNTLQKIGTWEYSLSNANSLKYASPEAPSKYYSTITRQNILDTYEGRAARESGGARTNMRQILNYMKNELDLADIKPYVFIIDEINRGEMSKIFGELFFSIDPGYRGKEGLIQTQYQNLVKKDDVFIDGFYVPKNVYIIGTMNDIDRSVESMDFAMRRRFAFKEVFAEDSQAIFDNPNVWKDADENPVDISADDLRVLKNRMNNLNQEMLDEKYNLNKSYQIGGAYFLKYTRYLNGTGDKARKKAFEDLWEYHIQGVLREYLRGMDKAEDLLISLKNAYDSEEPIKKNPEDDIDAQ